MNMKRHLKILETKNPSGEKGYFVKQVTLKIWVTKNYSCR